MPANRSVQAAGWVTAVCIAFFIMSTVCGCGRKLPPIQPGTLPPPAVFDLAYEVRENEITLFWSLPAFNPAKERAPAGFKVLRARQTAVEAECRACPLSFQMAADMAANDRAPGSRMRFQDVLEPGFKHSYKLQAYTVDGVVGKDSNLITVTY